jgi:N-dimethylarginine dimethylaminohydrolase
MQSSPSILMCPPDFYGIEYEINPWMSRSRRCDHSLAVQQWRRLRTSLEELGASVFRLPPVPGLPDLVFTANAALICRDLAVLSRFRRPERQGEARHFEKWLSDHGFRIHHLEAGVSFEGAGDALFCGEVLFAGYRIRSGIRAHQEIGAVLGCRVIPLELVDARYYHLDTCFCPLAPNIAVYYPWAFDSYARRVLKELIGELIPVSPAEATRFACNAVVIGNTVVTNAGCPLLGRELRNRGFNHIETPLGEFLKSGGAAKCLTLRLDGEEAACWNGAAPLPDDRPPLAAGARRRRTTGATSR